MLPPLSTRNGGSAEWGPPIGFLHDVDTEKADGEETEGAEGVDEGEEDAQEVQVAEALGAPLPDGPAYPDAT
jgi:hypothetical protein